MYRTLRRISGCLSFALAKRSPTASRLCPLCERLDKTQSQDPLWPHQQRASVRRIPGIELYKDGG